MPRKTRRKSGGGRKAKAKSRKPRKSKSSGTNSKRGREKGALSPREKGLLMESLVEEYMKQQGYSVRRNIILRGFSGAKHEIDILADNGTEKVMVEVKNHSRPIPKEWIMKAYNISRDLGLDKVLVVSSSGFTEDARKVAEALGVSLLTLDDLVRTMSAVKSSQSLSVAGYVGPVFGPRKARELALHFAVRRLFKPVETPTKVDLLYYPLYVCEGTLSFVEEEGFIFKREIVREREAQVIASAVDGSLPAPDGDRILFIKINGLNDNEAMVLHLLVENGDMSKDELIDETGWSRQKLSYTLRKLLNKNLIEYDDIEDKYYTDLPAVEEIEMLAKRILGTKIEDQPTIKKSAPTSILDIKIPLQNIKVLLMKIYSFKLERAKIVYVPMYRVRMEKEDGSYRTIMLAGWEEESVIIEFT